MSAASDVVIRADGLSKRYRIGALQTRHQTFRDTLAESASAPFRALARPFQRDRGAPHEETSVWALRDVSFEVRRGEVVGIVGRNGAGKSTLLKVLSRITEPTEGRGEVRGRIGSLLEVGTGFHPELTGRENVFLNGAILGMRRAEILLKFDEIVAFAEVERFIDTPVKHYSTGMYLRLAFAVAAHLEPEILLVDEVLAVGDAAFQRKCLGKMGSVAAEGRTVLFVSHNMGAIRSLCTEGLVLEEGRMTETREVSEAIESYFRSLGAFEGPDPNENGARPRRSRLGRISVVGAETNTADQAAPFEVSTTLHVEHEITGFSLICSLQDMHGRSIFRLVETSGSLGLAEVRLGQYVITTRFPPLWLTPGLYSLFYKIEFDGGSASGNARSHHSTDAFPLDVSGTSSASFREGVEAVLHPVTAWSVSEGTRT